MNYPLGTASTGGVVRTVNYDPAGRIVGYAHTTSAGWDQTFGYDGLDRLLNSKMTASAEAYAYGYDDTGNRTSEQIAGTWYTLTVSPTSNWYTSVQQPGGVTAAQSYDLAGHLQGDPSGTGTTSARGGLSAEARAGGNFSYLYNGLEQRVYKSGPSSVVNTTGTAYYVYDEAGHLLGEYDASGHALYETVYLGDTPVAALTQPTAGQTTVNFIYADHLDTARVIVRALDHKMVWTWGANEPFGQSAANDNPGGVGSFTYNPRFPGQVADAESGWFYNWHRDYDPTKGRYVQFDPIGLNGGINTYVYVEGSPLVSADPVGLELIAIGNGLNVYAYPGPPAGGNEHARQGPGENYHVHIKDSEGNDVRISTETWKPLTPEDAKKMTKPIKSYCDNLSDSDKKFLDKVNREVFHAGRSTPQMRQEMVNRLFKTGAAKKGIGDDD